MNVGGDYFRTGKRKARGNIHTTENAVRAPRPTKHDQKTQATFEQSEEFDVSTSKNSYLLA